MLNLHLHFVYTHKYEIYMIHQYLLFKYSSSFSCYIFVHHVMYVVKCFNSSSTCILNVTSTPRVETFKPMEAQRYI